jgi:hypothetical protein
MTYMTGIYLVSAGRLGEPHRGTGGFPVPSKEGKSRPADLHPLTLLPPATQPVGPLADEAGEPEDRMKLDTLGATLRLAVQEVKERDAP